jgi:drug/metabolite transporter (DMT)-like permease
MPVLTFPRTTNDLTTTIATSLSSTVNIPLPPSSVEYALRVAIFAISFFFTGTMWAFYTKALSAAPSAVHANIVNTSSNFIITALLGALIFGEHLPPLWWAGAGLLVSGSVIIGRRDQGAAKDKGD